VLGWKNALSFQNGAHADIVVGQIGQPDFFSAACFGEENALPGNSG
jgi:hypothetical protein